MATKKNAPLDITTYKVPDSITKAIKNEVAKRTQELQEVVNNQKAEIIGLHAQLNAMSQSPIALTNGNTSVCQEFFAGLSPQVIIQTLRNTKMKIAFNEDFGDRDYDRVPLEFMLHVIFYNDRFLAYRFLDEVGIKYEDWHKQIILPHEWDKECLDAFVEHERHQYVCNGCIYKDNMRFWYNEQKKDRKLLNPMRQIIESSYSEIPWQIILRNPLWADDDLIAKIAKGLKKKEYGSHMEYFVQIPEYNNHLTPDQLLTLISATNDEGFKKMFNFSAVSAAVFASKSESLRKRVISLIRIGEHYPAAFQEDYINSMPFDKAMSYIHNNKTFSEKEKAALIENQVKRQYSKGAILERVLES